MIAPHPYLHGGTRLKHLLRATLLVSGGLGCYQLALQLLHKITAAAGTAAAVPNSSGVILLLLLILLWGNLLSDLSALQGSLKPDFIIGIMGVTDA